MFWQLQAKLQLLQLRGLLLPSMHGLLQLLQAPQLCLHAMLQVPVVVLQGAAVLLQVPVVVLRQRRLLQRRIVPQLPEAVVPRVLLRVRLVVQKLYRGMPVRPVRQPVLCWRVLVLAAVDLFSLLVVDDVLALAVTR
jgi:hypothetical protein